MRRRPHAISRHWLFAVCGLGLAAPSAAVDLGTLIMPGPVAAAHAKTESDCRSCHRPFDASAQDELCLECHEPVAEDIARGLGVHGRARGRGDRTCRSCHPEHLGRDADITGLDREVFSHAGTDFPLEGAHSSAACGSCHEAGSAWREAPSSCLSCHREDDRHLGGMGESCGECHDTTSWRHGRFDHSRTEFSLGQAHQGVECGLCHPSERYRDTPTACLSCHAADDVHLGGLGPRCGDCHSGSRWREARFDHDRRTDFPLRGAHRRTPCEGCHATPTGAPEKPPARSCRGCHAADDAHDGRLGPACESCHRPESWQETPFDHAAAADFPLRGAHSNAACAACHRGTAGEVKLPRDCVGCHAGDDVHRGALGQACGDCHAVQTWSGDVAFDHDMSSFPLLGLHAVASCSDCHASTDFGDAPLDCDGCHASRDVHHDRLGTDCSRCHNPNDWATWHFDHARGTRFALRGAHAGLDCLACHTTPSRGRIRLSVTCERCHSRDDPHRGSFGGRCGRCHGVSTWEGARVSR